MKIRFSISRVRLVAFMLCLASLSEAKVKLPTFIADGMVLQREQDVPVWGTADPGEEVIVSFLKKKYRTNADAQGNWKVVLPSLKPGGPHDMTINEITLKDILIGDVFLCSGQSNMELPISRVADLYAKEVSEYTNPMIWHIKIPLSYNFHEPQTDTQPSLWKAATPEDAPSFSALAYFFAKDLYAETKVPVGLINSSVGGSPVEAWISEEGLKPFPKYLSERDIYQSDEFVSLTRELENKRSHLWQQVLYKNDPGLHEPVKWYQPDYNDDDWKTYDLFDSSWGSNGLNPVHGSHWFRKEVELPQSWAGKEATLRLGCIVDADSVYVNGVFVGTVSYQYPPRIYKIPAPLLKAGMNLVTVRLMSHAGYPHFVKDKPYKIIAGSEEVSLEGTWKYKQGAPMPAAFGQTFFQYKPVGLYNAMIAPLKDYAIKGAIWYQGESNTGRYNEYYDLLTAMIQDWRTAWNQPDLPFVIVELASFGAPDNASMQKQWAAFREVQRRVAQDTPHAGIASAFDLGEWNDIHPLNKKELGKRVKEEMMNLIENLK